VAATGTKPLLTAEGGVCACSIEVSRIARKTAIGFMFSVLVKKGTINFLKN
jgi:hypothetical protein